MVEENEISRQILDAAITVHETVGGPGLLESVYRDSLVQELRLRGLKVEKDNPIFAVQTLTYLRLMKLHLGLLINFGRETLVAGYKRIVNGYV